MTPEMNLAEIFAIHNPLDKECLKEVEQAASLARTALSFKISSHSRHVLFYSESSTDGERL